MIIEMPIKTEKAITLIERENTLTFVVSRNATKNQIKEEVERLFSTKVSSVRTHLIPKGQKRALVRLADKNKAEEIAAQLKMIA